MNRALLTTLCASLVLFLDRELPSSAAPAGDPYYPHPGSLTILRRDVVQSIEFATRWGSLRDIDFEWIEGPGEELTRAFVRIADDYWEFDAQSLQTELSELDDEDAGQPIALPDGDDTVLFLESGSNLMFAIPAAYFGAEEQPSVAMLRHEIGRPASARQPRSEFPPYVQWNAPCEHDPADPASDFVPRSGLGLLGVYPDHSVFHADGELRQPDLQSKATIVVATDARGDLYVWFERS